MISKEIQLSLSFCSALAALLLISAPVNETILLAGSGVALLFSGGFFYGGISKYFADQEKQAQNLTEQTALLIKKFEEKINQIQSTTDAQLKNAVEAVENLDNTLNDLVGHKLNEISETLTEMSAGVNFIKADTESTERNTSKLKDLQKTAQETLDNIEDLSKNVSEISKVNETLHELKKTLSHQEEFYQMTLSQYKSMTTKDVELIENLARKLR